MQEISVELLKEEAKRLADAEIFLLKQMLNTEDLLEISTEKPSSSLETVKSISEYIEILEEAKNKLAESKMVITVVGAMKAGKSTTINAIIGSEVLPNRNTPMTALPTAICHTPGQLTPILKFENIHPINELISRIKPITANKYYCEQDIQDLASWISKGSIFQKEYNGADEIFLFLKRLNDIVRLSKDLELKFPHDKYKQIDQFPCIEVEFSNLKGIENKQGKLIILDTPGPNEFGQSQELRKILDEQLQRANAVLAVLDYTQLKSEADQEIRDSLSIIPEKSENIYVMVNKFDQKGSHGLDEEKVKNLVTNELMKNIIKSGNQVFPVSSRYAYLANRTLNEININNQLPDYKKQPWVREFSEKTFGMDWEEKINDKDLITKNANKLWEKSYFSEPIEKIINKAHDQSNSILISSFTETLEKILKKSISHNQSKSEILANQHAQAEKNIGSIKDSIKSINETINSIRIDCQYFKSTSIKEEIHSTIEKHAQLIKNSISTVLSEETANRLSEKFQSQESISIALRNLQKELEEKLTTDQETILNSLAKIEDEIKTKIHNKFELIKNKSIEQGIEISNIKLSFETFQTKNLLTKNELSLIYQNIEKQFSTETEIKKKKKRKGVSGTIGELIDIVISNDIGIKKKKIKKTFYCADVEEIEEICLTTTNTIFESISKKIENQIEQIENIYLNSLKNIEEKAEKSRENKEKTTEQINSTRMKSKKLETATSEITRALKMISVDLNSFRN